MVAAIGVPPISGQPSPLASPVGRDVGLECVGPSGTKAECLEAHVFEGDVADQDKEIGPGDLVTIFLLDGPEETSSLVEGAVVGPGVEGSESLLTLWEVCQ